jgi:hypothetical protein
MSPPRCRDRVIPGNDLVLARLAESTNSDPQEKTDPTGEPSGSTESVWITQQLAPVDGSLNRLTGRSRFVAPHRALVADQEASEP